MVGINTAAEKTAASGWIFTFERQGTKFTYILDS